MVSPLASIVAGLGPQKSGFEGFGQNMQALALGNQQKQLNQQRMQVNDMAMQGQQRAVSQEDALRNAQYINRLGKQLLNQDESKWPQLLRAHVPALMKLGYTAEMLQGMNREQVQAVVAQTDAALGSLDNQTQTAGQRERADLLRDLNSENEQVRRSAEIELGLEPRAGSTTARERIALDDQLTDNVAESEAIIAQRKKFGELSGSSRAKKIDQGFESIQAIDKNIRNLDAVVQALDEGATTGVIESKFAPTLRASTIKLEQLQNELALDVIGSVTFGALSEGELQLARDTALPKGLQEDDLRKYILDKKDAQEKLRAYYQEQIDFLDEGGTVAGFLRKKRRQNHSASNTTVPPASNKNGWKLMTDANGNQAYVSPDGTQFEEVN